MLGAFAAGQAGVQAGDPRVELGGLACFAIRGRDGLSLLSAIRLNYRHLRRGLALGGSQLLLGARRARIGAVLLGSVHTGCLIHGGRLRNLIWLCFAL